MVCVAVWLVRACQVLATLKREREELTLGPSGVGGDGPESDNDEAGTDGAMGDDNAAPGDDGDDDDDAAPEASTGGAWAAVDEGTAEADNGGDGDDDGGDDEMRGSP
jgi:hypothetical protein